MKNSQTGSKLTNSLRRAKDQQSATDENLPTATKSTVKSKPATTPRAPERETTSSSAISFLHSKRVWPD